MLVFLSLLLLFTADESQSYTDKSMCDVFGTHIYEELGCEGKIAEHEFCPDYYVCPDFKRDTDFCMFGGNKYKLNEKVNGTSNCKTCECKYVLIDGEIKAGIQCHPQSGCANYNSKTCTNKYVVDKCCPIDSYCTREGENKCDCYIDGYCYREGQRFVPRDSCYECVCRKGFTGFYVAPFCRKRRCDVEVKFGDEIRNNCAAVFDKVGENEAMCCPNRFICPNELNEIENINFGQPHWQSCYFGKEIINRNASFYIHREIIDGRSSALCKCITPPLLTCIE